MRTEIQEPTDASDEYDQALEALSKLGKEKPGGNRNGDGFRKEYLFDISHVYRHADRVGFIHKELS